jgi:hypothetical protein
VRNAHAYANPHADSYIHTDPDSNTNSNGYPDTDADANPNAEYPGHGPNKSVWAYIYS